MNTHQNKRLAIALCAALVVPVTWLALLAAPFFGGGLLGIINGLTAALQNPFHIKIVEDTPRSVLVFLFAYAVGAAYYFATRRNTMHGLEHGSAAWGDARALGKRYRDHSDADANVVLTQCVQMGLDGHMHKRNLNVLVCGGSGAGKTQHYAIPNLMQLNTSFVALDPKGEIVRGTGAMLEQAGYDVRILDLLHHEWSDGYNPFVYLRNDADVMRLITNLIKNTTPIEAIKGDPFWEKTEQILMEALMYYLYHFAPPEEQNFPMVVEMLEYARVREDDEDYMSPLDILFERRAMTDPDDLAVKQYALYKQSAGKTAKSINISVASRLGRFSLSSLAHITRFDDMGLADLGQKKVALFAVIPDTDTSFNFIVGMLYTQLFQVLFDLADYKYKGRLPMPVHFIMDEFCNVALPDDFPKILSTCRSRAVNCSIIIQNIGGLKAIFEKQWESIIGNCDEFLYLGGNESATHKLVSEMLGKQTIDTNTYGKTHGPRGSYTTNDQRTGRELMTPDEVRLLDNRFALLFVRGEPAVRDDKFDVTRHPRFAKTERGGAQPYDHGKLHNAIDWRTREYLEDATYELLSDEELDTPEQPKARAVLPKP